jgi:hypothetical protein
MPDQNKADGECQGVDFYVDEYWKFRVPSLDRSYDSYKQMADALERHSKEIVAAKRAKLNLPVICSEGESRAIVGIHAGNGSLTIKPKQVKYSRLGRLYPDLPWIRQSLEKMKGLRDEAEKIEAALGHVALDLHRNTYRFDPSMHAGEVQRIEKEHAAKTKAAEATTLAKLLEKPVKRIRF